MKNIMETLQALQDTPVPNLLVIAGFVFLLLALVGRIGAVVELAEKRQKWAGIIGALLLILGIGLSIVPVSQPDSTPTDVAAVTPDTPTVTLILPTNTPVLPTDASTSEPLTSTPIPEPIDTPIPKPPSDTPIPEPTDTPIPILTPTTTPTNTLASTPTSTAVPIPDAVVIVNLNLRSGPGMMYDVIGVLNPGQVLTVTGRSDSVASWLQVNTDQKQGGWVANLEDLVKLNLSTEQIEQMPTVSPPPTPTPSPVAFTGKVCQIRSGWDTNTIFLRQEEFNMLGQPIGSKVTVAVRDTGESVENVTLSLDSRIEICSVRLARSLREALGVDSDTAIEPERERPDRGFYITPTSPPANEEAINIQGKVCQIKQEQDTKTIFLRQAEFDAFGIPAGTTVSVTVLDTGNTVEKITLSLDSGLATCTVRLPKSYREALGVAGDTDIDSPENRPDRQFTIRLPQSP